VNEHLEGHTLKRAWNSSKIEKYFFVPFQWVTILSADELEET